MNILFFTLLDFESIQEGNIYTDLLREFVKNGNKVYAVSPVERRKKKKTYIVKEENVCILKLKIGNIQKTNKIEKGISTVLIETKFIKGIKKYFYDVKFDLILYSTPPITFYNAISYVKKRDNAKTYLMLKDIFPQNAVDLGMLRTNGVKGILYKYFRRKEKRLYKISDRIGCMSNANMEYVLMHNSEIDPERVEICPNSICVVDKSVNAEVRERIRKKYDIPLDKTVFIYGGNLGKPQGIPFLLECLESQLENEKAFFLIIGDGTEFSLLQSFVERRKQRNVKLMQRIAKEDYDAMVAACDIGMIFLDHRFTIPNFPSRMLSYMQAKIPVLAVTDLNTDVGQVIIDGGFGWWCESNSVDCFEKCIQECVECDLSEYKENAFFVLQRDYAIHNTCKKITESII